MSRAPVAGTRRIGDLTGARASIYSSAMDRQPADHPGILAQEIEAAFERGPQWSLRAESRFLGADSKMMALAGLRLSKGTLGSSYVNRP